MRLTENRSDPLVAIRAQIPREHAAERLLGGAGWRSVVVREIEVRDAEIERAKQRRAAVFEGVDAAEIVPEPE